MRDIDFHPITDRFPSPSGAAYERLRDDIQKRGLQRPIALFEGKIWDGRARYEICRDLGVDLRVRPIARKDRPIEYLILRSRDQKYGKPSSPERSAALETLHQIDSPTHLEDFKKRRSTWLAKARNEFKWQTGRVQDCAVCGKHAEFVHAHHTLPLNIQFELGIGEFDIDHTHDWLCPTHHRHIHMMISVYVTETRDGSFLDNIPDELQAEWLAVERVFGRTSELLKEYGGTHGFWRGHDQEEWE